MIIVTVGLIVFLVGFIFGMELQTYFSKRDIEYMNAQNISHGTRYLMQINETLAKPQENLKVELIRKNLKPLLPKKEFDELNLLEKAGFDKNHAAEFVT